MKKLLSFIFVGVLSLFLYSCNKEMPYNDNGDPVSLEQSKIIMDDIFSSVDYAYMYNIIIPANTPFSVYDYKSKTHLEKTSPEYDSWMILINPFVNIDSPAAYWDYYYVNTFSGKIEHFRHENVPDDYSGEWFSMRHFLLLVDGSKISIHNHS